MNNTENTTYIFSRSKIKILIPASQNSGIESIKEHTYVHHPDLHEAMCDFADELAKKYALSAFGHICTQCGNCCRREDILVMGSDIFEIANHQGITEEAFRKRYLRSTNSWNDHDGFMKLKKGRCPFLKMDDTGYYNCTIYDVRPQSCRIYPAMGSLCEKTPGYLLEFLDEVKIEGDEISLSIEPVPEKKPKHNKPWKTLLFNYRMGNDRVKEAFDKVVKELSLIEEDEDDELEKAIRKTEKVFDNFLVSIEKENDRNTLQEKVVDLHKILDDLYKLTVKAPGEYSILDNLWKKLRLIEAITTRKSATVSDQVFEKKEQQTQNVSLFTSGDYSVHSISMYPELITLSIIHEGNVVPYPMHLSSDKKVRDAVRDFIKSLVQTKGDMLHTVLSDPEPICYLCGECCSYFGVEIAPSDIRRLSNGKNMKETEFRERYLKRNEYSWNRGDACMRKQKLEGEETSKCVLLEKRDDGFYYCSIHSIKPSVCRGFSAQHHLCRIINHIKYWYRLIKNIIRVDLFPDRLILHTFYTHNNSIQNGFTVHWREEPVLTEKAEKIFDSLKKR